MAGSQLGSDDYSLGWICALPRELEAARRVLDKTHEPEVKLAENDENTFMVGIGGGVPSESSDIRLGDVVVSKLVGKDPGVVQYDFGRTLSSGLFEEAGSLNKPPRALLTALPQLQTDPKFDEKLAAIVDAGTKKDHPIAFPGCDSDRLFGPNYPHPEANSTCDDCDQEWLVHRERRVSDEPRVHYGLIASGNQVMKDAIKRDQLAKSRSIL